MPDDTELLGRFVATRADEAFAALVQRHIGLVYSAALRRVGGDAHLAEDVAQQVFVALARQAPSLTKRPALAGWLYTTTRFVAAQLVRAERRRQTREQQAHRMNELISSSAPDPEWEQLRPLLDAAMDRLAEADREALLLRFFEKRSLAEVGAIVRLGEDAARKRIERALERLRLQLERRGIRSTSAAVGLFLSHQAVGAPPAGLAVAVSGAALSAAGSAAGSVLAWLPFMKVTKLGMTVVAALAILAVGIALREVQAHEAALLELAQATESRDLAKTRLAAAERGRPAPLRAAAPAPSRGSPPAVSPTAAFDARAEGQAFLAAHPEAREAFKDTLRSTSAGRYADLFRELQLPPDKVAEFLEIVIRGSNGVGLGPKGYMIFINEDSGSTNTFFSDLRELLGESHYRRFQAYSEELPGRRVARRLASALFFTAEPLSPAQAERFGKLVLKHTPEARSNVPTIRDWNAIAAGAESFLGQEQLVALGQIRRLEDYDAAVRASR